MNEIIENCPKASCYSHIQENVKERGLGYKKYFFTNHKPIKLAEVLRICGELLFS